MLDVLKTHVVPALLYSALVLLVVITSVLKRPQREFVNLKFPAPLGARIIAWGMLGTWALLILPALDLGIYWLAALFGIGPLYTLWKWPENIEIDEFRIYQFVWCHRSVSIEWHEIESITLGAHGDSLVLRSRNGDKIKVSAFQVGAHRLVAEIAGRTGIPCPAWQDNLA